MHIDSPFCGKTVKEQLYDFSMGLRSLEVTAGVFKSSMKPPSCHISQNPPKTTLNKLVHASQSLKKI